jgi:hypothetical protein
MVIVSGEAGVKTWVTQAANTKSLRPPHADHFPVLAFITQTALLSDQTQQSTPAVVHTVRLP